MVAPQVIRRQFRTFRGINQAASDLDRPGEFAETADNIRHYRRGDIGKREGFATDSTDYYNQSLGLHLADTNRAQQVFSTGFAFAQSIASGAQLSPPTGPGASAWTNPNNALTSNDSYATAIEPFGNTEGLAGYNFDWPEVPVDANIIGIEFLVEFSVNGSFIGPVFPFVQLLGSGAGYQGETSAVDVQTTDQQLNFGGKNFDFDFKTLTASASDIAGLCCGLTIGGLGGSNTFRVDAFQAQLFYTLPVSDDSQELLTIGAGLQRRKLGDFSVNFTGGGPASFSVLPVDGAGYRVSLTEGGLPVAGWPKDYQTSRIGNLIDDINALPDWEATATPYAKVSGSVTDSLSVVCDASPFTLKPQDRIATTLTDTAEGKAPAWRSILEISGTTLSLDATTSGPAGQYLGLGVEAVTSLPIVENATVFPVELKVPYWSGVPNISGTGNTIMNFPNARADGLFNAPYRNSEHFNTVDQKNFSFTNIRSNTYFAVPFDVGQGYDTRENDDVAVTPLNVINSGLWKYDGIHTHLAGLPVPCDDNITIAATSSSGGLTASSDYRYRFQFTYKDGNGNVVDGPLSKEYLVSLGGGDNAVQFDFASNLSKTMFPRRYATTLGAQTEVNQILVSESDLLPGLEVRLWDDDNDEFVTRTLSSVDKLSVTIDGAPIDTLSAIGTDVRLFISHLRLLVWRTEADGTLFYLSEEVPFPAISAPRYVDRTTDGNLGEVLLEPDRFADPFPKLQYLTTHQGLLVGSGNPDDPEVVYFADALNPEASPLASSNFRVTGGQGSRVTALASDNDDMLAVFKDESYFNIVGDLDSLSFQVLTVSENDYGCPSHHALVKVNNTLIFPSNTGFKAIAGGALQSNFEDRLVVDFNGNFYDQLAGESIPGDAFDKLVIKRATAAFNAETGEYLCYIPAEGGNAGVFNSSTAPIATNSNSKIFVLNLLRDSWYNWEVNEDYNLAGGIVAYRDRFFWNARYIFGANVFGRVLAQRLSGTVYDFYDNYDSYEMKLRMTWDSADLPATPFRPLYLKPYRFEPSGLSAAPATAFDLTVKTYRDYDESTVFTEAARSFSLTDKEKRIKFRSGKARALSVEFSNDVAEQKPVLTGYEYTIAAPYGNRLLSRGGRS